MSWENTLLPASFRGVVFEVVSTSDDIERSIVVHEYPYVDGGNVDDLGRVARRISMTAVFYGDDYETQLQQFLAAIDIPGSGELIHPIFGAMQVQFGRSNVPHDATTPDYTKITLEFIEAALRTPLFDRVLPMQTIDAINLAADNALDVTTSQFGIDFSKAISFPATLRDKLSADMLNVMDNMRTYCDQIIGARGWLSSGAYYLNNPTAFVDDLSSGLVSRLQGIFSPMDLRLGYSGISSSSSTTSTAVPTIANVTNNPPVQVGYARGGLTTVWQQPLVNLQQPLLTLPATTSTTATQPFLVAHVTVQQTIAIASAASELFSQAIMVPVLTPADIESVAGDVRQTVNTTIALVRATYPDIVQSRPITESLKALALTIADAAEKLIRAKPPLIDRLVDTPGNLQLLAFLWYGDYLRSDELLRLNPQIRNPNFICSGATLRAYAA